MEKLYTLDEANDIWKTTIQETKNELRDAILKRNSLSTDYEDNITSR